MSRTLKPALVIQIKPFLVKVFIAYVMFTSHNDMFYVYHHKNIFKAIFESKNRLLDYVLNSIPNIILAQLCSARLSLTQPHSFFGHWFNLGSI